MGLSHDPFKPQHKVSHTTITHPPLFLIITTLTTLTTLTNSTRSVESATMPIKIPAKHLHSHDLRLTVSSEATDYKRPARTDTPSPPVPTPESVPTPPPTFT